MDDLWSIDPGVPKCAAALWVDAELAGVGVYGAADLGPGLYLGGARSAVLELPQSDGRAVPTRTLIELTAAGCLCAARLTSGQVALLTPSEWKGSTKKPIHHDRMWEALSSKEQDLIGEEWTQIYIQRAKKRGAADGWRKKGSALYYRKTDAVTVGGTLIDHNVLDAVGLGLRHLGRIDRNGYPT